MREFTVVKHEYYPKSAPDGRYSVCLKSDRGRHIFFEGGADIQREFPIGAKFTLVPADYFATSGTLEIDNSQPETQIESAIRIVEAL